MITHSATRQKKDTPKSDAKRIKAELRERGTSLFAWATDHGYPLSTVYTTVDRWAGRTDRTPHGGLARQIIEQLRADLGAEVVPFQKPGRSAAGPSTTATHGDETTMYETAIRYEARPRGIGPQDTQKSNRNLLAAITEMLQVCTDLSHRGCRLLAAHCHTDYHHGHPEPVVLIDPPPHSAELAGAIMIRRQRDETLVTRIGSVQIEWTRQRGGAA